MALKPYFSRFLASTGFLRQQAVFLETARISTLVLVASLVVSSPAPATNEPALRPRQDLRELVSGEQFRSMGLHKLDEQELEKLNIWLYGHVQTERQEAVREVVPEGDESFGLEDIPSRVMKIFTQQPEHIESRLLNENFRGWDGKTVFYLENGQVWKQIDKRRFVFPVEKPEVEIRKGLSGAYYLKLKNKGSQTTVRRIK